MREYYQPQIQQLRIRVKQGLTQALFQQGRITAAQRDALLRLQRGEQ